MNIRTILSTLAAGASLSVFAAAKPGEIGDDFTASLAYAKEHNVPLVVTWGNKSCSYCNKLAKAIQSNDIKTWVAEHQILFVEKHEAYDSRNADYVAAMKWIESINPKIRGFPYMGMYWENASGEAVVETAFTARVNILPVSTPANNLAAQLIGTMDKYVGDYKGGDTPTPGPGPTPSESGDASFVTADTVEDRLEATAETKVVYVPLKRETANKAAGNKLEVTYPDGSSQTVSVTWKAGEAETYVAVAMPEKFVKDKKIILTLREADGTKISSSSIAMVANYSNSPTNPHWVGEYSSKELPYGEWTMDYATAREKLISQGGYIIAMFSGVKWCPYCLGADSSLFADKKFYSWAKKNKVILVLFDQPKWNSADGCQYVGPRLLSYNNDFSKSGASYLSRKGLKGNDADVIAAIDMQWDLTRKWLAPETAAKRLSNPTILLLNGTGDGVAARENQYYEVKDQSITYPTTENLNRLSDLLLLVDADEDEGYRTVTPLTIAAGSGDLNALQVNATRKFYHLTGVTAGQYVKVVASVSDKYAPATTVALYAGDELLASGSGRAVTDRPVTAAEAAALCIEVSSFAEDQAYGAKTTFAVALSADSGSEEMVKTVAFSSLSVAERKVANPSLYKKQSATVPIYKPVAWGGDCLVGTLAVNVTSANKISAKFSGLESVSFSGTWDEINLMTGAVTTELSKSGVVLSLKMDAEGGFEANLEAKGTSGIWGSGASAAGNLALYEGAYTVTLVDKAGQAGTAYLTVKTTKQGKATVAGVMPDGTTVSSSTTLAPNADGTATLAIFKNSAKGTLSVALAIDPDAKSTWGDEGKMDTVRTVTGCYAWWNDAASAETQFNVFGGFWKNGTTPVDICEMFDLSDTLNVVIGGTTNDTVKATKKGFTVTKKVLTALAFAKATGVFSGKATLNVDGKSAQATVKGVLLPGWIDCGCTTEPVVERPYGSGTLFYKDGKTTVSMPIDLVAESAE